MKKSTSGAKVKETASVPIKVRTQKSQVNFKRVRDPKGPDHGIGGFLQVIEVTAQHETIYVPTSIASGKKPAGFVYRIEGTAESKLSKADISCKGEGVMQLTIGTIVYSKIPKGKKASFRIFVEMRGKVGKAYTIVIEKIHYKLNPSDARYEKYLEEIRSRTLHFR